ncbi:MAG: hypothetical protein HC822_16950 [Oscillochloris sp.]|nr:hypothetical protein [Oscillochloris sp.]
MEWRLVGESPVEPGMVAVSRLIGPAETRVVHLPSFALEPVTGWQPNQIYLEQFEIMLPADLPAGSYNWSVGWYDLAHPEAHATNGQARIDREVLITNVALP